MRRKREKRKKMGRKIRKIIVVEDKPKKMKMRRKLQPVVKVKVLHPTIYTRKDGKQTCFVCYKPLHTLRDLLEMKGTNEEGSNHYDTLKGRVNRDIVCLGKRAGTLHPLYRCTTCEPGSNRWLKNPHLNKLSKRWRKE